MEAGNRGLAGKEPLAVRTVFDCDRDSVLLKAVELSV